MAPIQRRQLRVTFIVSYDDGRLANLAVRPQSVRLGNAIVAEIARRHQRASELPPGRIIAVQRAA